MSDIIKTTGGLDMVASLSDVLRLADTLAQARGGFIPSHFQNSAQVAAVILAGRELGVGPMAALRSFYLVNGKLGMDASFVSGRMLAHGIALEWLRDDDECARRATRLAAWLRGNTGRRRQTWGTRHQTLALSSSRVTLTVRVQCTNLGQVGCQVQCVTASRSHA